MRVIGVHPSTLQMLSVIMLSAVLFFSVWLTVKHTAESKPVYVQYYARPQIIIDAGHGGTDGGAVGVNNTVEKHINLSISRKLAELLSFNGFEVILTREDDDSIHDPQVEGIAQQKRSDMVNRLEIIKEHPNAIFISIHQNMFSDSSCKGAQMFYSINHDDSQKLAQEMQEQFRKKLQPDNMREIKAADDALYLLDNAKIPAILVECGFLSNPQECEKLCDENYQEQIAFTVFTALLDFYRG